MTRTILFVCPHGAAKSVLAAAYFQRLAGQRGLDFESASAGTAPDSAVHTAVAALLELDGLPPAAAPRMVTEAELATAYRVVSFGCNVHGTAGAPDDWSDVPALGEDFEAGRAAIEARVEQLVNQLAQTEAGG